MPKCYVIEAEAQCVREASYETVQDLRALVGGSICVAWVSPLGDVLYVDDDGMLKPTARFFLFDGRPDQPLAGNGVLVGADRVDGRGDWLGTDDPIMGLERLTRMVRFVSRDYVDAWGRANASEPAITITTRGARGPETVVLRTYGGLIRDMPQPLEPQ